MTKRRQMQLLRQPRNVFEIVISYPGFPAVEVGGMLLYLVLMSPTVLYLVANIQLPSDMGLGRASRGEYLMRKTQRPYC